MLHPADVRSESSLRQTSRAGEGDAERLLVSQHDCRDGRSTADSAAQEQSGRSTKLDGIDTLDVRLDLDTEPRVVKPPADLVKALKAASVWDRWQDLSYSHQREHVEAIDEAKKPETRTRRIERAVQMVRSKR